MGGGGRKGNSWLHGFVLSRSQTGSAGSENEELFYRNPCKIPEGTGTSSWDAPPAHSMVALGEWE